MMAAVVASGCGAEETSLEEFIDRVIKRLEEKDIPGYLETLAPELRETENMAIRSYFDTFRMDKLSLRRMGQGQDEKGRPVVFLQAHYENDYSVILENWKIHPDRVDDRWRIAHKDLSGSVTNLYKIRIPSDRIGRSRRVEVEHRDIRIEFSDAVVFFDNIPDLDTALVVLGKGRLSFTPSNDIEKHQLELLYGQPVLEETLDHLFLRCSNHFFGTRVKIHGFDEKPRLPVTEAEIKAAASVFSKNHVRSFTVESSLDRDILSFLPQGDEAVLDFHGPRVGDMTYVYHPFSEEEVSLYDRTRERIISLYSPRRGDGDGPRRMFISFADKFNVEEYLLDVDYDPGTSFLSATARIRIVSRVEALDSVKLRLNPSLEILKVSDQDGRELFVTQDRQRKIFYAHFIVPPSRDAAFWMEITYRGRIHPLPPSSDLSFGTDRQSRLFAARPRYDTYLFTQNSLWYPSPAHSDYFTARLNITVPPGYTCISSGNLVETDPGDDPGRAVEQQTATPTRFKWETRVPVKYVAFIVGRFEKLQPVDSTVPLDVHFSSGIHVPWRDLGNQAAEILDIYSELFGPFPYEAFNVVYRLWPDRGGHSPPSFVVLNETPWLVDGRFGRAISSPVDISTREDYFLAHEIAHQWWGQAVTWGTYRDHWLSEGLSQYAAVLYLRKKYGEREFGSVLKKLSRWTERKTRWGPIILGSRLSYHNFEAFQAIVYGKAALALHMLSDILGEDLFYRCLKEFYLEHRHGRARTGQFIRSVERTSGRDLSAFFRGWFFSHDLPRVLFSTRGEKTESGYQLRVRVIQSKDLFVFPLWVEWRIGRDVHRKMIDVDGPLVEAVWEMEEKPRRIRVNPDGLVPGTFRSF